MTASTNITPFNFNSHDVRVVVQNGEPWFVATDVAESLGYKSPKDAASYLDDDEKGSATVRTPGGDQKLTVINESGLYALVLRSRKPEARKFAKWVTSEVLPSIRKTGSYTLPSTITPDQAQDLKELVQLLAESGKMSYGEAWSRLHRKFRVNSYLQLKQEQFTEACLYLKGKLDGESIKSLISKHIGQDAIEQLHPIPNVDRLKLAIHTANTVASRVQEHIFNQLVDGSHGFSTDRWLISFNHSQQGPVPVAQAIEREAFIATATDFARRVNDANTYLTNEELASIAAACNQRLTRRLSQASAMIGA